MPKTLLAEPMRVEVLAPEEVVKGAKEEQPLTSVQSTLVTTPSSQSSGAGGKDAKALMDLALQDLAASFNLKLSRQDDPKAPGSLTFLIVAGGSIEEREPEVVSITTLEQAPSSTVGANPPLVGDDDIEMVDSLLVIEPVVQKVSTSSVSEREVPTSSRGEGFDAEVPNVALDEITIWMVGQLGDHFSEVSGALLYTFYILYGNFYLCVSIVCLAECQQIGKEAHYKSCQVRV